MLETILAAAVAVNRFIEAIKPGLEKALPKDWYEGIVRLVACLAGILVAFVAGGLNIVPESLHVPQVAAVVLTGILIGLGSDAVNWFMDLLYGWQTKVTAKSVGNSDVVTTNVTVS